MKTVPEGDVLRLKACEVLTSRHKKWSVVMNKGVPLLGNGKILGRFQKRQLDTRDTIQQETEDKEMTSYSTNDDMYGATVLNMTWRLFNCNILFKKKTNLECYMANV